MVTTTQRTEYCLMFRGAVKERQKRVKAEVESQLAQLSQSASQLASCVLTWAMALSLAGWLCALIFGNTTVTD